MTVISYTIPPSTLVSIQTADKSYVLEALKFEDQQLQYNNQQVYIGVDIDFETIEEQPIDEFAFAIQMNSLEQMKTLDLD